jgi:hypothetical protein
MLHFITTVLHSFTKYHYRTVYRLIVSFDARQLFLSSVEVQLARTHRNNKEGHAVILFHPFYSIPSVLRLVFSG